MCVCVIFLYTYTLRLSAHARCIWCRVICRLRRSISKYFLKYSLLKYVLDRSIALLFEIIFNVMKILFLYFVFFKYCLFLPTIFFLNTCPCLLIYILFWIFLHNLCFENIFVPMNYHVYLKYIFVPYLKYFLERV